MTDQTSIPTKHLPNVAINDTEDDNIGIMSSTELKMNASDATEIANAEVLNVKKPISISIYVCMYVCVCMYVYWCV